MAETYNIGEIATRVSEDIFEYFRWNIHPATNHNFDCLNGDHKTAGGSKKQTHPTDVVFYYDDPYLGRKVYLNTDLKSYGQSSINQSTLRNALRSLAISVQCACASDEWRTRHVVDVSEPYEVRGLLFLHNHDHDFKHDLAETMRKIDVSALPIAENTYLHVLGPLDINRLYSVANDLSRLLQRKEISDDYTFYYPDLVLWRRHGEVWGQAATVETLNAPYCVIKHNGTEKGKPGYVIYYNRPGDSAMEFEYFLDSLSRLQLLDKDAQVRVRVSHKQPSDQIQSNFLVAKHRYSKAWGFEATRAATLDAIKLEHVVAVTDNYSPAKLGWRDGENE
ncbi:hypothetical protein WS84_32985 [Burkholderia anthina]|nr:MULTISPECIES: hypothetical protein [Burkholderia]KVH03267.1 hypothetical protein WS84_32985 [Burkholderia anthina]KVH11381.1 hypothetical protein WS85_15145 [Burkholderia anthina]KVM92942.1 hypothetical protein WT06_13545 [Burkholderia anthina]KVX34698.1 hypothetical protein WT32_17970 [Burkholderia anthina]